MARRSTYDREQVEQYRARSRVSATTFRVRLARGWDPELAAARPAAPARTAKPRLPGPEPDLTGVTLPTSRAGLYGDRLRAWATRLGTTYQTLYYRIHRARWPLEKALRLPVNARPQPAVNFSRVPSVVPSWPELRQWAAYLGIDIDTLRTRLRRWGIERAFTAPRNPPRLRERRHRVERLHQLYSQRDA